MGLPYVTGYYCKNYILYALDNSFSVLKGGELVLISSFFLTNFYILRTAYCVFLGSKNGHRKIYLLKPVSHLILYNLASLGFIILFGSFVWLNVIDTSIVSVNATTVLKSLYFNHYLDYEISYGSLYI